MNTFGKNIRLSIFGESHGKLIGITIDGIPSNLPLDLEAIKNNLAKRHGQQDLSTERREKDEFEIVSGYFNNKTTGAPLTIIIKNNDVISSAYEKGEIRPSHADLPAYLKYLGANDYRGGGHSSGRLTACLVIAGSICEQILKSLKIPVKVYSYVSSLHNIKAPKIDLPSLTKEIENFKDNDFTLSSVKQDMINEIVKAKKNNDSLGGTIDTIICPCPATLGEPFFDSFESILSHLLFSIPGVKGILFGDGLGLALQTGNEQIDEISLENDQIIFHSNHQGGINGGITNGNYVNFTSVVRAPSSTEALKHSINLLKGENINLSTKGRHDPTFVHRLLVVINAITYIVLLELLMEKRKNE